MKFILLVNCLHMLRFASHRKVSNPVHCIHVKIVSGPAALCSEIHLALDISSEVGERLLVQEKKEDVIFFLVNIALASQNHERL